ncbi:MAG: GNAT family N-acetyltransferase [Magnetospiraceae bacterium]
MSDSDFHIRPADAADFEAITAIYADHVQTGLATFETVAPDLAEMTQRWKTLVGEGYPYLVASSADGILGYAYAGPFHRRIGYRHTVEDSIYLANTVTRRGVGTALLSQIITESETRGYRQMIAVIGDSRNRASIGLHRKLGFSHVGILQSVGHKLGQWVDSVYMQRVLGDGNGTQPP